MRELLEKYFEKFGEAPPLYQMPQEEKELTLRLRRCIDLELRYEDLYRDDIRSDVIY